MVDGSLIFSFTAYLTIYLFHPSFFLSQQFAFIFPLIYAFVFSSEPKLSVFYWLFVLTLIFNLISVLTYPVFDLIPSVFHFTFPSHRFERILCILSTNVLLFLILKLIIRLKKKCRADAKGNSCAGEQRSCPEKGRSCCRGTPEHEVERSSEKGL